MNTGKTVFAQLMDFLPRVTFWRIVGRYDGDAGGGRGQKLLLANLAAG